MSIIIFLIILLVLVVVHEWGHFFSAKRFGMRVDEFGFGMGPKIAGIKKGETEYTLNAFPIGGFVKIHGENPDEEGVIDTDATRNFSSKPAWQQAIVLFAGIFMNFVLAWILFSIGFMNGLPASTSGVGDKKLSDVHLVVLEVSANSPAQKAGIKSGDKIVALSGEKEEVTDVTVENLQSFVSKNEGKEIEVDYLRGKNNIFGSIKVTPEKTKDSQSAIIGIAMDEVGILKLPFFESLWQGLKFDISMTKATAVGLFDLVKNSFVGKADLSQVTGPVGLVNVVGDAYKGFGLAYLISFAAMISVNLAIINLIPFPALDGGRLFFLLIEKIKGSPIKPKVANIANLIGFSLLMLLMLVVTYHDIVKLF